MRNCILMLWLLLGMTSFAIAQKADKVIGKTAKALCKCIGEELKDIDAEALNTLIQMLDMEAAEPGSGEQYLMGLSTEQQMKMLTEFGKLQDGGGGMTDCLEHSGLQKGLKDLGKNGDMSEEQLFLQVAAKMESIKGCEAARKILQMGLQAETPGD